MESETWKLPENLEESLRLLADIVADRSIIDEWKSKGINILGHIDNIIWNHEMACTSARNALIQEIKEFNKIPRS